MHTKKNIGINIILVFVSLAYSQMILAQSTAEKISVQAFVEKPFLFEISVDNFMNNADVKFKRQRYMLNNKENEQCVDTIYKFYRGGIQLFVNRRVNHPDWLFTGIIKSNKLKLNYGIAVGMLKDDFLAIFKDIPQPGEDKIRITKKDKTTNFTFYFANNKLKQIKIDNLVK